jgi:Type IV secretion system pilin
MTSHRTRPARRGSAPRRPERVARRAVLTAAVVMAAVLVLAGGAPPALAAAGHVLAADSIPQVIANARNWVIGILAALATLFLTIGGVRYVLAGGDPSEVERAKTAFRSAAMGYALAILAPVIVAVLKSLTGG